MVEKAPLTTKSVHDSCPPGGSASGPAPRILVVRLSALGDVLHCLPALAAIRASWPNAIIDWVCEPLGAGLLDGHPHLRDVIRLDRGAWKRDLARPWRWIQLSAAVFGFVRRLRFARYDWVLDFQGNARSQLVSRAARGRNKWSHHPSEVKEFAWLFRLRAPSTPAGRVHRTKKYLHLVEAVAERAGVAFELPSAAESPEIPSREIPSREIQNREIQNHSPQVNEARSLLPDLTPEIESLNLDRPGGIALHPFVSAFGRFKEWPLESFAALARNLVNAYGRVWITSAPDERDRARKLLESIDHSDVRLAPQTGSPRELAAFLSTCDLVVAADTGPLHLSAALGIPVVGLFGPKDPAVYGPNSKQSEVVRSRLPCSPCRLRSCEHAVCMQMIAPDEVQHAVGRTLNAHQR